MKKNKIIAGLSAFVLATALVPMSAFAAITAGTDGNPVPNSTGFEVSYDVDPSYTVTIPAGVDITTGDKTTDITLAEGALLEEGTSIKVVLESAANTTSGKAFTAKTESGNSSAGYKIEQGTTQIGIGDTVATLNKDSLTSGLKFSKTNTPRPDLCRQARRGADVCYFG